MPSVHPAYEHPTERRRLIGLPQPGKPPDEAGMYVLIECKHRYWMLYSAGHPSSHTSIRSCPWKWLGEKCQPLIFLWCTMMRCHQLIDSE